MRAIREDLDRAVVRIRSLEGHHDVLRGPDFNDIAVTVLPGEPLVYLLPLEDRTLGLLVSRQAGSEIPRVETLWLASLRRREGDRDGKLPLTPPAQGPEAIRQIMKLLRTTVGEGILRPLANRLRALSATGVILIPGWMLGAIYPFACHPLHKKGANELPAGRVRRHIRPIRPGPEGGASVPRGARPPPAGPRRGR